LRKTKSQDKRIDDVTRGTNEEVARLGSARLDESVVLKREGVVWFMVMPLISSTQAT